MVWMGVEKEENGVESETKARPYERIGRKMRTMIEREEPMSDPDLIAALSKLLATLPGIAEEKTATHATFLTGKKIFAFTRSGGGGVALKLPKERIAELLQRDDIAPLAMGKRTMKEWILLDRAKPADYRKDLALFKEAITCVAAGKRK
jgi:hypothetical protein